MIINEQMDTLIGRLKVYGSESGRGKDHPNAIACRTAASVIIEQQAEIERLREALELAVDFIADATVDREWERGECRSFNELMSSGNMPPEYYTAREALGGTQ